VADRNRIRDRLSVMRQEAEKLLEQRQRSSPEPPLEPAKPTPRAEVEQERSRRLQLEVELDTVEAQRGEAARQNAALADERARLEASRVELEQARLKLEHSLADAELAAEQARVGRDRARAELEATRSELERARAELEAARARGRESSAATAETKGSQRRSKSLRAEKRIAELEGQLETERELRQDLELALESLQGQRADDAAAVAHDHDPPAETASSPEPVDAKPAAREPDGWGVPLEAFPVDADESGDAAEGSAPGARRRSRLRPRGRSDP
jgi:hypothetical protein